MLLYAFKFSETTTFQASLEFTKFEYPIHSAWHCDNVPSFVYRNVLPSTLPLLIWVSHDSTSSFYNDFEPSVFEIRLGFFMSSCFLVPLQENPEISAQQSTESAASPQGFSCSTVSRPIVELKGNNRRTFSVHDIVGFLCCIYILNVHTCICIMLYCEFWRKHA